MNNPDNLPPDLSNGRMRTPPRATRRSKHDRGRGRSSGSSPFGILLRRYRVAAGFAQKALAERARMRARGIGALERGYRRTPQRETLALLVSALALSKEQHAEFKAAAARSVLLGRGASVTVGPWGDGAAAALPLALTSFVGRETQLNQIAVLVRDHRLITITGAGGVGKTQTALHVATALSEAGDIPVCFVGLAPIGDPSLVAATIASALGVQEMPNRPLLETLVAYLKNKSLLLSLDNCEHVITEAATAARVLLAGCPRLRFLATSREPLKAAGEFSYRLPSLSIPSPNAAHDIRAADAVHMEQSRFLPTGRGLPSIASGSPTRTRRSLPTSADVWMAFRWRLSWPPLG